MIITCFIKSIVRCHSDSSARSIDGDADAVVGPEFELDGINSGSWYHCLPIRMYH